MLETFSQIVGAVAAVIVVLSFQCKEKKKFLLMQMLGGLLWTVSFLSMGRLAGALLNAIGTLRAGWFAAEEKKKRPVAFVTVFVLNIAAAVVSGILGDGYMAIAVGVAQLVGTYAMWFSSDQMLRVWNLCAVCPLWLFYNLGAPLIGKSIILGSVVCECFNMLSAAVFLIRLAMAKKKKEKSVPSMKG